MKELTFNKPRLVLIIFITISLSFIAGNISCSWADESDNSQYSSSHSSSLSASYMNAEKARTDALIKQLDSKISKNITTDAIDKPVPELKHKTSTGETAQKAIPAALTQTSQTQTPQTQAPPVETPPAVQAPVQPAPQEPVPPEPTLPAPVQPTPEPVQVLVSTDTHVIDSINYNVQIGSGTGQITQNDRLISEVIGGVRHVYVGFNNVGTDSIQDAINHAIANGGGIIIVKGGADKSYAGFNFGNAADGIKLYGGYSESGERDINNYSTIINGDIFADFGKPIFDPNSKGCEINGFIINGTGDVVSAYNGASVFLANNTINGWNGLSIYSSYVSLLNNTINGGATGIWVLYGGRLRAENNLINGNYESIVSFFNTDVSLLNNTITGETQVRDSKITAENNTFKGAIGVVAMGTDSIALINNNMNNAINISVDASSFFNQSVLSPSLSTSLTTYTYNYETIYPELPPAAPQAPPEAPTAPVVEPTAPIVTPEPPADTSSNNPMHDADNNTANSSLSQSSPLSTRINVSLEGSAVADMFRHLLSNREALLSDKGGFIKNNLSEEMKANALAESSLATPATVADSLRIKDMEVAIKLADIMNNPTNEQKLVIDTVASLMKEMDKAEGQAASPELKKATDDLLQMVASILLAQAVPDLLREGDVSNIKIIFSELAAMKGKLVRDYQEATKPYYAKVKEMLANNLVMLQMNNVLFNGLTKDELDKLPPDEIDKLLEKMRKAANRSGEEEYMLQQELEYRKLYLDPNRKAFEDNMKAALQEFTKKLNSVLK